MQTVTVKTSANIALQKYWGKRNTSLILPTKSSLSVTLSELTTTTSISFSYHDEFFINGLPMILKHQKKIKIFLDLFRKLYVISSKFKIETVNNFPTAAGLASSASGFAALATALNQLCNLNLSKKELSILARQGSGSATRSLYGGFVLWHKGNKDDGSDSYAEQVFNKNHWPELRILVVIVDKKVKKISSRDGMQTTIETSPKYKQWLAESEKRLPNLITAIKNKDFLSVGNLTELEWEGMQQVMLTTVPKLDYWTTASYKVINQVKQLRDTNTPVFFTTDAGPNVKVFCEEKNLQKIKSYLEKITGVQEIIICTVGSKSKILSHA